MRRIESFDSLKKEREAELGSAVHAILEVPPRGNFPVELPGFESASVTLLPQEDSSIMVEVFTRKKKGKEKNFSYALSRDGRLVGKDPLEDLGATREDLLWHITQAVRGAEEKDLEKREAA